MSKQIEEILSGGYKPPIEIIMGQMRLEVDNGIYKAVQGYGVNVDKEELIRALKYDRGQYEKGYADGLRHGETKWISVEERVPTESEYLTRHNDGTDTLKRLLVAYQTDTIEYQIGCYDGYKWLTQHGNKVIKDVIAWKPFDTYEPPKGE